MLVGTAVLTFDAPPALLITGPSASALTAVLKDVATRVGTPVVATDAILDAARSMFEAAMETDDPTAQYLVLYSSLATFSLFKVGRGNQVAVDQLLLADDATIPQAPGRHGLETSYTAARNKFIHAEDRGKDPIGAMGLISTLLPGLKKLTTSIISRG